MPFEVDRKLLKDLIRENMGEEVSGIEFLSVGMSFFSYRRVLPNICSRYISQSLLGNPELPSMIEPLAARVARRFMPCLKTSSEVATMAYLRERSKVPVPKVFLGTRIRIIDQG
jgi:hypothetical protein